MSKLSLSKIHQQVNEVMPQVNDLLVKKFSLPKKISYKAGGIDHLSTSVVTETDQQVEELLRKKLLQILPGSGFIGEETPAAPAQEYNWIIDPIDGTQNFANHVPIFAISIALWQNQRPIYALTSFPMFKETVHAFSGQGVFLNNHPLKFKKTVDKKPLVVYSLIGDKNLHRQVISAVNEVVLNPRNYGSCVFHGSNLALGRIKAGVFINQALWDIAAIVLLAKEARLTIHWISPQPDLTKDDLKKYQYSLVIGPEKLAEQLVSKLK
jgi:myo-inositol-1(or 4)-monophosphatase